MKNARITEPKFAAMTVKVWRAYRAYETARKFHAEHPNYKCRQIRLQKAAARLNRATLSATAEFLPDSAHLFLGGK